MKHYSCCKCPFLQGCTATMCGCVVGVGGGEKVGVRIIKHWIKKAQATKVKIKIPASIRCVGDFPHPSVASVVSRSSSPECCLRADLAVVRVGRGEFSYTTIFANALASLVVHITRGSVAVCASRLTGGSTELRDGAIGAL